MTSFKVRELSSTDTEALLAFESRNREWFESHIDAREPSFYSEQGVADHIQGYLSDFALGVWHPFVIEGANGEIVGRANLKSIDSAKGSAEVGYRVGERACGQGLATLALKHLIREAQARWALTHLVAYVYPENVGSQKVLGRCGFLAEQPAPGDPAPGERRFVLTLQT
ncbi:MULTISPECIES: GNAT family N-acetyltransferase [unclassified Pseudomonas]|uniref:GNAT family N-acetyltransferase n=1 Tax=unclassified Pseudomonas TaxID=196821 RepID=UPI0015A43931|nr:MULTISPECIES: GNAT family N-acetyltransferase [unclassified Pseudomonas]NWC96312.1 GNAT family N-acetyltransferase [Pseudomonas sp. IPO3779]NWD21251.1 GNAT family N-acetyltransferase [Pseudomonas sp. IPO3778]